MGHNTAQITANDNNNNSSLVLACSTRKARMQQFLAALRSPNLLQLSNGIGNHRTVMHESVVATA
jgi:hypothetical protein